LNRPRGRPARNESRSRDRSVDTNRTPLEGLLGLLEDLHHAVALGGREGPGLHEEDEVADPDLVRLVVSLDPLGPPDDLAVERVLDAVLDLDHHGLVHLVAHDVAATRL